MNNAPLHNGVNQGITPSPLLFMTYKNYNNGIACQIIMPISYYYVTIYTITCILYQHIYYKSFTDVIVCSPAWTTYKPQSQLAHHTPYLVSTSIENEWKLTPQLLEEVSSL